MNKLSLLGLFRPAFTEGWLRWPGSNRPPVTILTDVGDGQAEGRAVTLRYRIRSREPEFITRIAITQTVSYGAHTRHWFICPGLDQPCGKRVMKLHLPAGRERFACRECHRLTYARLARPLRARASSQAPVARQLGVVSFTPAT